MKLYIVLCCVTSPEVSTIQNIMHTSPDIPYVFVWTVQELQSTRLMQDCQSKDKEEEVGDYTWQG